MKIIFLDMDGVMNRAMEGAFSADCILHFKKILANTDAKVVISSSWRKNPMALELIRQNVCEFIDCTPVLQLADFDDTQLRGQAIFAWLKVHPEVEKYAIIDDVTNSILQNQIPNLFQPLGTVGLTEEIADKVIEHLK